MCRVWILESKKKELMIQHKSHCHPRTTCRMFFKRKNRKGSLPFAHVKCQSIKTNATVQPWPGSIRLTVAVPKNFFSPCLCTACLYRRENERPTSGIPLSCTIITTGLPLSPGVTSYVPSCLRWLGEDSRAHRMFICWRVGMYPRICIAHVSMPSSLYLWPLVKENRLRWGRSFSWERSCFSGF